MKKPVINKLLTPYNFTDKNSDARIKYIVIHYVGALGGAKANCQYYAGRYIGASAHFFVGFDGEIWQAVETEDIAWHCGANSYKHAECRNSNSIGIEMCVRKRNTASMGATDKDWYFEDATVEATAELTQYLMEKYNVPASHVIRHYDVTGKICPNPYVYNAMAHTWEKFKQMISGAASAGGSQTNKLYRVRKSWEDAKSQIGAFSSLDNAKKACTAGYNVYDWDGKAVYSVFAGGMVQNGNTEAGVPFNVKVDILDLNIRTGAGTDYAKTGEHTGKGVFTIVEVKAGKGSTAGWGRLKSGAGWISLDYATRLA